MRPATLRLRETLGALAGIGVITFFCYWLHANATIAAIVLLLAVLVTGAYCTTAEAILASFAGTLFLDYFFVPPLRSINIGDPQGWIVLLVFLAVALVSTNLSVRLRRQRDELISQRSEAEKLYAFNRAMLFGDREEMHGIVVNKCMELFGLSEVALFESATGRVHRSGSGATISDDLLRRVATEGSTGRDSGPKSTVVPIFLGNKSFGSLGLCGDPLPWRTLQALGNTIALGLARTQAQEAGSRAEAVRKSEELKSMMIDALAHDLKTPLTAIEAAAGMLQDPAQMLPEQRRDLLEIVQQQARGLRRMVNEAIHLARIDADRLRLERRPTDVRELVGAAVQLLGEYSASHAIDLQLAVDVPLVFGDKELLVQALKQLLDNALKYSPPRSRIVVSANEANERVSISIRDQGPGLTELEQSHVFDKFYRGRHDRSGVQGTGMGLAIAREIVEAHGGSATVESQLGHGSRFTIVLPAARLPVEAGPQLA